MLTDGVTEPDLSVIIAAYNVAPWIAEAIESVFSEAERDDPSIEVVVVDDGSSDTTADVVRGLMPRYPLLRLHQQANAGPGAARGAGVEQARGRFICFLDGDDRYRRDVLADAIAQADDAQVDLLFADRVKFPKPWDSPPWSAEVSGGRRVVPGLASAPGLAHDPSVCNKLFRRTWFIEQGWAFPDRRFEDVAVMMRAYVAADRIAINPGVMLEYRQREDGSSFMDQSRSAQALWSHLAAAQDAADVALAAPDEVQSAIIGWLVPRQFSYLEDAARVLEGDELERYMDACAELLNRTGIPASVGFTHRVFAEACRSHRPELMIAGAHRVTAVRADREGARLTVAAAPDFAVTVVPLVRWSLRLIGENQNQVQVRGDLMVDGADFDDAVLTTEVDVFLDGTPVAARIGKVTGRRAVWASAAVPIADDREKSVVLRLEGVDGERQPFGRQRVAITGDPVTVDGRTMRLRIEPEAEGTAPSVVLHVDR